MNDGVMGAVNGAMPSLGLQRSSLVSRWVRDPHFAPLEPLQPRSQPPEYEIRKQRHEPSRHNFPNHLILFKFPHALLALVDQNEARPCVPVTFLLH